MPQDPTTVLYNALYSAMAEKFSSILVNPQTPVQLQFPLLPMAAIWANSQYPTFDALAVGDDPPLNHGLIYEPNAASSIWSQYGTWVNGLLTPNRASDPGYVSLSNHLAQLTQLLDSQYNELSNNFSIFQSSPNFDPSIKSVTQYIPSMYSGSLGIQYQTNQQQAHGISVQMQQYLTHADPMLKQAVANYSLAANQFSYQCPPPVNSYMAGVLTIGQGSANLSTDLQNWQMGAFGAQGFGPVTLAMGTVPVYSQQTINVTVYESNSYFFGLFSDSYSTSYSVTQTITTFEGYNLDVKLSALACYPLFRSNWLSLPALSEYRKSSLAGGLQPEQFFDAQTGTLALIPAYVLVGFNPTLTLTMATNAYNQYADAINNTGMKIGPFLVGGASSQPAKVISQDPSTTVVQFASNNYQSIQPYVMGMIQFVNTLAPAPTLVGAGAGQVVHLRRR